MRVNTRNKSYNIIKILFTIQYNTIYINTKKRHFVPTPPGTDFIV